MTADDFDDLAGALDCFWNAATQAHRDASYHGDSPQAVLSGIVEGVQAVANRLRELAAGRARLHGAGASEPLSSPDSYRGWTIEPPRFPEPWTATGPNFDASWKGPEGGWFTSGGCVRANSREKLCREIDIWIAENEMEEAP